MEKNIIKLLFLTLILLGSSVSCDDLLEQKNPNALSTGLFWEDAQDVEQAVVGMYSPLSTVFGWGRYLPLTWIRRADEYTPSFTSVFTQGIIINSSDIFLPSQWPEAWKVIFRANDIIDNVELIEGLDSDVKNKALGQAYFLRGLYYFYLVNTWDNIPFITKAANSTEDFFSPNSTPDVIYEQIIKDAAMAKSLLPEDFGEPGRATWGAATALLGKAYLYTQQWASAASEFQEIISSNLYKLVPNYENNFKETGDNNEESLFEIQFTRGEFGWSSDQASSGRTALWTQLRAPDLYGGEWIDQVNPWILEAFLSEKNLDDEIDERAFATLAWNHPNSTIYLNQPYAESALDPNKIYAKKNTGMLIEGRSADNDLGQNAGLNTKLIRYADILLMHAEAVNEASSGGDNSILNSINAVRARANMPNIPTGLSKADLRDVIRKERILELSLENDRFFDLKRWGVVVDRMNGNSDMVGNTGSSSDQIRAVGHGEYNFPFAEMHTRVPIPIAEIQSNPNMKQNPGY